MDYSENEVMHRELVRLYRTAPYVGILRLDSSYRTHAVARASYCDRDETGTVLCGIHTVHISHNAAGEPLNAMSKNSAHPVLTDHDQGDIVIAVVISCVHCSALLVKQGF